MATYQQRAYDYLKTQITTLKLKPGQQITDVMVAQQLDISRTPVREAFYRLENEGLLIKEGRGNWRVYTLTLDDIHQIFDVKVAVEGMLARKAANCTDPALRDALKAAVEQMRHAAAADDPDGWLAADIALHNILFDMVGNDRARRVIANINDQWHRVRIGYVAMQTRIHDSTGEHIAFVESILAGDGATAERQMQTHLDNVRETLVHVLATLVLPFVKDGV
jgi:DNA-binding GntR family transcriptional regulator